MPDIDFFDFFRWALGTVVTIFLSNDATAVVLTPAVPAVVKAALPDASNPVS